MIKKSRVVPTSSTFLQISLEAEAHLSGQLLLKEQTLNGQISLMYPEGTGRPADSIKGQY
jgi:hypothetical protein